MKLQLFSDRFQSLNIIKDFAENCGDYGQILKGGLALNYLYGDEQPSARATIDIDYSFQEQNIWNKFKENACNIATNNSELSVRYSLTKIKVNPNGESLLINWQKETSNGRFKIDMNYGNYCKATKKLNLNIYAPEMILADKINVLCSGKIRRRIKDLYDIYLIASHEVFDLKDLSKEIKLKLNNIKLGELSLLNYIYLDDMERAYKKIKLINMPDFNDLCSKVLTFVLPVLNLNTQTDSLWNPKKFSWNNGVCYSNRLSTDVKGVLCLESASGFLELSSFPPYPILLQNPLINLDLGIIKFSKENFNTNYIEKIGESLYVTTPERTIIDMLLDSEFKIMAESLETYIDEHESLKKLIDVARFYNKEYELIEAIKEMEEYNNRVF